MNKFLMSLAIAGFAATNVGCGCCSCFLPKPAPVCAAPVPACPPVAADPCTVPTTTSYGYAPTNYGYAPAPTPGM